MRAPEYLWLNEVTVPYVQKFFSVRCVRYGDSLREVQTEIKTFHASSEQVYFMKIVNAQLS